MDLIRSQVEVVNALGLHLRAACQFAGLAQRYRSRVRVARGVETVDGKSVLGLATLAAECGARLDIEADGPDAEEAIFALTRLVKEGFPETGGEMQGRLSLSL
jgi:phosphocarrier protein